MYFYSNDIAFAVTVILHRGSSSDDDLRRYVDAVIAFDKRYHDHPNPIFVLVSEPGSEPPNAKWRQRIGEASRGIVPGALVVFESESTLTRGIVTAINWVRPPPYTFVVTNGPRETLEWLDARRPGVKAVVQRLYFEARAAADHALPPKPRAFGS